jgi:hypothetical protein
VNVPRGQTHSYAHRIPDGVLGKDSRWEFSCYNNESLTVNHSGIDFASFYDFLLEFRNVRECGIFFLSLYCLVDLLSLNV